MKLTEAVLKLNQSVVVIRDDVAYDSNEQVVSYDLAAAEALVAANAYKELRSTAYPSIWADTVASVKSENPKP